MFLILNPIFTSAIGKRNCRAVQSVLFAVHQVTFAAICAYFGWTVGSVQNPMLIIKFCETGSQFRRTTVSMALAIQRIEDAPSGDDET